MTVKIISKTISVLEIDFPGAFHINKNYKVFLFMTLQYNVIKCGNIVKFLEVLDKILFFLVSNSIFLFTKLFSLYVFVLDDSLNFLGFCYSETYFPNLLLISLLKQNYFLYWWQCVQCCRARMPDWSPFYSEIPSSY